MQAVAVEADEANWWRDVSVPVGTVLLLTILLAVDDLNPVKILCSYAQYYQGVTSVLLTEGRIGCLAALLLAALVVHQKERVLYYCVRTFFRCTFNNMFFSSIEIVGLEHLPKTGPVILTGNHNNQFVDGIILLTNCDRQVSFMIAQKSFDRPLVGFLAKAFHCIPVSRPQDIAFPGAGSLTLDGTTCLRGEGTAFVKQLRAGDQVEIAGEENPHKVKSVSSDTQAVLEAATSRSESGVKYKVHPKVDQSKMFDEVYGGLRKGRCLGIFPEGGSHDRTDLLPLKAGVAMIALDAFHKHHMTVPIVPVGLNYFKGHRFGGRVVVEFGPPIVVPEQMYLQYESDRHAAIESLLGLIATGMRSVIVPTPDYHTLQQIYMARRLYVPDGLKLSAEQTMDLNRRFAIGLKRVLDLRTRAAGDVAETPATGAASSASAPGLSRSGTGLSDVDYDLTQEDADFIDAFKAEVEDYSATLKRLGLKDHQVRQIGWWGVSDLVGRLLYLLATMLMGAIPQLLFNLPVMLIASKWAVSEQHKALKASKVKVAARDVVMSYKIIYVLTLVPVLYVFYGSLILFYFRLCTTSSVLVLTICPFFAFLGMKASEQGIRAYTDLLPLFKRFLPATREEQDTLPARRKQLQKKLNKAVKKFGPLLGDLYHLKSVDWAKEIGWFTHAAERAANLPQSPSQDPAGPLGQPLAEAACPAPAEGGGCAEGLARRLAAAGTATGREEAD